MKKSELLKLLELDIEDTKNSGIEFQARMVLARCISVGMLPPNDWHHGVPLTHEAMINQHTWEDENETE